MKTHRGKKKRTKKQGAPNAITGFRENGTEGVMDYFYKPCIYINSKPVNLGTAVFLKNSDEIDWVYKTKLRNLIDSGHRFMLVAHNGLNKDTIGVCLLSTSQFMNENKRKGIKLSDVYTNHYKDVYMDVCNCWIINKKCVKSVAYELNSEDTLKLYRSILMYSGDNLLCSEGLIDDEAIFKELKYYKEGIFKERDIIESYKSRELARLDILTTEIYWYSDDKVKSIINSFPRNTVQEVQEQTMDYLREKAPSSINDTSFVDKFLASTLIEMHKQTDRFVEGVIRGYSV